MLNTIALLLLPLSLVHADTPRRDPLVASLRERFRHARAPRREELAFGHDWACHYASAYHGSRMRSFSPNYFTFEPTEHSCVVSNRGAPLSAGFQLTATALVGAERSGAKAFGYDRVRIEQDTGALLVEYTLPRCSGLECVIQLVYGVRSLDDGRSSVIGYRECHVAP